MTLAFVLAALLVLACIVHAVGVWIDAELRGDRAVVPGRMSSGRRPSRREER